MMGNPKGGLEILLFRTAIPVTSELLLSSSADVASSSPMSAFERALCRRQIGSQSHDGS
jgi:hypothetical protein